MSEAGEWYVATEEGQHGPASTEQVIDWIRMGYLGRGAHVCPVGGSEWALIEQTEPFAVELGGAGSPATEGARAGGWRSVAARGADWLIRATVYTAGALLVAGIVISGIVDLYNRHMGKKREQAAIELAMDHSTTVHPLTGQKVALQQRMEEPEHAEKYEWRARQVDDSDIYLVSFVREKGLQKGWGMHFEVDMAGKTVRQINDNPALKLKYGVGRERVDVPFDVELTRVDLVEIGGENTTGAIALVIEGTIHNRTQKTLSEATIQGVMTLQFNDEKVLRMESDAAELSPAVDEEDPWRAGTGLEFKVETEAVPAIYREYEAILAKGDVELQVSDPVGYNWKGVARKIPLDWSEVMTLATAPSASSPAASR